MSTKGRLAPDFSELKRLHVDTDSTFVYVTHDQLEAMTLATKICLMDAGVMQQYDPPLITYSRPNNLFVADFVGNPTMNFIDAVAVQDGPRSVRLNMYGIEAVLECDEDVEVPPAGEGANAVVGVRPEFMTVSEKGEGVAGKVYSTLPSGMETTVKIHYGDQIFTSVVFGGVDYAVNQPIHFSFRGKDILLFGKESGKRIGVGGIRLL